MESSINENGIPGEGPGLKKVHLLTFQLDKQIYALPIESVRQIVEMVTITPVLQMSEMVEGVINFHGVFVPVVNLRCFFHLSKAPRQLHTPILLAVICGRLTGLIVDEVLDVVDHPVEQVIHPKDILPEGMGEAPLLRGMVREQDRTVMLLDMDQLFHPQQIRLLMEAAEALSKKTETLLQETGLSQTRRQKRSRKKPAAHQKESEPSGAPVSVAEGPTDGAQGSEPESALVSEPVEMPEPQPEVNG